MPSEPQPPDYEHRFEDAARAVEAVRLAHFRLVWIAGGASAERSRFMDALAIRLGFPGLRIGRDLSSRLLNLSPRGRAAAAGDQFLDLLLEAGSDRLCLDHLEVLFDPVLRLNPVETVKHASRRFTIVAAWPGGVGPDGLVFGPADHPAHVRVPLPQEAIPVIALA